jgi:hypothetical protein
MRDRNPGKALRDTLGLAVLEKSAVGKSAVSKSA